MNRREREKIDLKKRIEEEKASIEAEYNQKIEEQKRKQFQIEKNIEIAKAKISQASSNADLRKTYGKNAQGYIDENNSYFADLINMISSQSYARGISSLPNDQIAQVHAGERIIPASMNIPNMSNRDFVSAMLA